MSNSEKRRNSLPAANPAAAPAATGNLADRLDLLEARLRMPTVPPQQQHQQQNDGTAMTTTDDVSLLASLGSPTISQHSFKFDSPSISRSSETIAAGNGTAAAAATAKDHHHLLLPSTLANPSPPVHSSSLLAVSRAAEEHMRKIAALENNNNNLEEGGHFSNSSYQTVKRSHTTTSASDQHVPSSDKVVKESPAVSEHSASATTTKKPTSSSPRALDMATKQEDSTKSSNAKSSTTATAATTTTTETTNSKSSKRKSAPVKLDVSNVNASNKARRQSSNNNSNAGTAAAANNNTNDGARKRTRLQFSGNKGSNNPESIGGGNSKDATALTINNNSRSNHTPIKAASSSTTSIKHKAPKNNRLIRDFFTAVGSTNNPNNSANNTAPDATAKKSSRPSTLSAGAEPKTPPKKTTQRPQASPSPSPLQQVAQLQQKCRQMEQLCHEKEAQLKAVSNNRTIMQTAVQSALKQREAELTKVKKNFANYRGQVSSVIENLMRQQSLQEAQHIREKLAADATRLGRIVYTRHGMRSVESWEDGTATRKLQERREALTAQQSQLEQRQIKARAAAKPFMERASDDKENNNRPTTKRSNKATPETVEGIVIQSKLDALEAVESVRYHLAIVQGKLNELEEEEKRLKQEKVAHLQAWKRLASEDASRFRDRPKLHDRYVLMALLGKGGFSEVWRAFDVEEMQDVAVKVHQLDPRWSDEKKDNFTKHVSREYEIHRNVRHPRIVSLLDVFEVDTNSFCTVLELCEGTDLEAVLKQKSRLPERDARAILLQILSGMNYLSHPSPDGMRQGIIHYDLKPGNILFDAAGDAKITDFGLSKINENDDPGQSMELTSQGAGTYWYLPPECFIMEEDVTVRISNKVDVWSIGVIYFQVLYGRRPFGHGQTQDRLLTDNTMLNAKEVVFPEEPRVSNAGKDFIRSCLEYDQLLRPTIAQLCESPYLTTNTLS